MKPLFIFCLFIMIVVFAQLAQAQTVDEVIDKHIAAMGGKEKLASLKSAKMEGNLSVMGNDVALVITTLHGVGMRADISVMGTENYQIITPTKGIVFMPVQGMSEPTTMAEDQLKSASGQLDLQGPLFNYKEKRSIVELIGKENVDGEECYNIKLTNKTGNITSYFISTKTHFKIKTSGKSNINGTETELTNTYSNYKQNVDGYWFPYTSTNAQGTTDFSKIDTNIAVDESIFK